MLDNWVEHAWFGYDGDDPCESYDNTNVNSWIHIPQRESHVCSLSQGCGVVYGLEARAYVTGTVGYC